MRYVTDLSQSKHAVVIVDKAPILELSRTEAIMGIIFAFRSSDESGRLRGKIHTLRASLIISSNLLKISNELADESCRVLRINCIPASEYRKSVFPRERREW